MQSILPKMVRVPEGATQVDRVRMFQEHCAKIIKSNSHILNADGSNKSIWRVLFRRRNRNT